MIRNGKINGKKFTFKKNFLIICFCDLFNELIAVNMIKIKQTQIQPLITKKIF